MAERQAFFFKYATLCQECGERHRDKPLFTRTADELQDPETWFCEQCGEPLFPETVRLTKMQAFLIGHAGDRLVSISKETDEDNHRRAAANVIEDVMKDLQSVLNELNA